MSDRRKPYHFEIPLPNGGKCVSNGMDPIELCVAECKRMCDSCDGDWTMAKETWETLIRSAIDRIVSAGKCLDFNLGEYRSDD